MMKQVGAGSALARALFSNLPEASNELLFRKGDILTVIDYDYDGQPGWWLCSHRGQRGICPSNYLELLEDKYSQGMSTQNASVRCSWSQPEYENSSESSSVIQQKEGEGNTGFGGPQIQQQKEEELNPLDTYDVPRCMQNSSRSLHHPTTVESSSIPEFYSNEEDQPLYQNEGPFAPITKTSPLDLYDVPRNELPLYGQSLTRLRKYGPDCDTTTNANIISNSNAGINSSSRTSTSSLSNQHTNTSATPYSSSTNLRNWSKSDLGLPPPGSTRNQRTSPINTNGSLTNVNNMNPGAKSLSQGTDIVAEVVGTSSSDSSGRPISLTSGFGQVQLRRAQPRFTSGSNASNSFQSNRSSIHSESAESGIGMVSQPPIQELYDVPRSVLVAVQASSSNASRPQSSISVSSSGIGLSIGNSDSKDSLLDIYDIPRSAKCYVNHMETKYDQVNNSSDSINNPSLSRNNTTTDSSISGHTRHNSTSSVFSAYGYSRKNSGGTNNGGGPSFPQRAPSADGAGVFPRSTDSLARSRVPSGPSISYPGNDLYDVPRSRPPPVHPRAANRLEMNGSSASIASSWKSQSSLTSEGRNPTGSDGMLYDIPSSFVRKVSLCDSSETISCRDTFSNEGQDMKLGASSSTLSSSASNLRFANRCNSQSRGSFSTSGGCSADVKTMPLGPKAAVSVSEKLQQEVSTSITAILDRVKPKWRSKENLTEIMPELRFSCVRLSLAIKDMSDFASRSMSNTKKFGDESLVNKLQRLITPVINGSQIIQRDVDELEAYFWSVDRLSISPGSAPERNSCGDALDQLILCARSLKHDVTEIANFLALNSSAIYREDDLARRGSTQTVESKVDDKQEDYDYVSLVSTAECEINSQEKKPLTSSEDLKAATVPTATVPQHYQPQLDSKDQQLLEFYSGQISVAAPLLSNSISTFITAIHQNEPPECFNVHLKYVILMAYKMLFAGDTVHRNLNNAQLKAEIETRANDLHKSILSLYESSKVATAEFPKIAPMQAIVDKVWCTTQAATLLKKVIFDATCFSL